MSTRKTMRLLRAMVANKYAPSVPFLRVIPTDYCNLECSYCWQRNQDKHQMDYTTFVQCVDRARQFKVGLVSFLGGEPTLWRHLMDAIRYCHSHRICTDVTTHGMSLTPAYLDALSGAGLDLLNISVDGLVKTSVSKKTSISNRELLEAIMVHLTNNTLRVRLNSVICKNNVPFIYDLLQLAREYQIPISLGFAMYRNEEEFDPEIHFSSDDLPLVESIVAMLKQVKVSGGRLIDPIEYYENFHRFLNREQFWVCNYATRRGWINVDPYGYVRDCTKKFGKMNYDFATLTRQELVEIRTQLAERVKSCNVTCYSNCAYDGAYFAKHKIQFLHSGVMG